MVRTFGSLGIPVGSILALRSDASVVCRTMNERSAVEYRGRVFSLSGLAGELKGYKTGGFDLFRYNGVLLSDIQPE